MVRSSSEAMELLVDDMGRLGSRGAIDVLGGKDESDGGKRFGLGICLLC
jgi:hypothetical protein